MKIVNIAELHKSIEIARYALANIEAKLECADVNIADKALTKAAHIMNKLLGEVSRQKKRRRRWMLKWTSEPPKATGWYWIRINGDEAHIVRINEYAEQGKKYLTMSAVGKNYAILIESLTSKSKYEWAGPIPEPIEPEEKHNAAR